jgi:uncharacterized protein (UPF0332 family)
LSEIHSLLERSERYLRSAEILLNDGDYDSSVSRVYYAMFYSVEALLVTKNQYPKSHKGVMIAFSKEFVKPAIFPVNMNKAFVRAFQKRNLGDYGYTSMLTKEEAIESIQQSKEFINKIKEYLQNNNLL